MMSYYSVLKVHLFCDGFFPIRKEQAGIRVNMDFPLIRMDFYGFNSGIVKVKSVLCNKLKLVCRDC